jgi:hypothetical protein
VAEIEEPSFSTPKTRESEEERKTQFGNRSAKGGRGIKN